MKRNFEMDELVRYAVSMVLYFKAVNYVVDWLTNGIMVRLVHV